MKKIKISISDVSRRTQLALILDRPEVTEAIFALRDRWLQKLGENPRTKKVSSDKRKESSYEGIFSGVKNTHADAEKFESELFKLMDNFDIPLTYEGTIEEAVTKLEVTGFNRIGSLFLSTKQIGKLYLENWRAKQGRSRNKSYEHVLFAPPECSVEEVADAFKHYKESNYFPSPFVKEISDTKSSIDDHRDWYWMHLSEEKGGEGKTCLQIAKERLKGNPYQMQETVKKAVTRYRKLLQNPGDI